MKKILRILPLMLVAVMGVALWSCSDDEPEIVQNMPTAAKTFLSTYFPSADIQSVHKDKDDKYEVKLTNGFSIDFNKSGEWTDVDAPAGQAVPTGFYPAAIDSYVASAYSNVGINEISRNDRGYEVELTNGTDLYFAADGTFIGIDPD